MAETAIERVPSPYQRRVVPQGLKALGCALHLYIVHLFLFYTNFLKKIFKKVFANEKFCAIIAKFFKKGNVALLILYDRRSFYAKRKNKKYCHYRPC